MMRKSSPIGMWIDGTCYKIKGAGKTSSSSQHVHYNICKNDEGKLSTTFRLPAKYYVQINEKAEYGVGGIERLTNTAFSVPKNGKEGFVVITGDDYNKVAAAREQMHEVCSAIRDKSPPLQFLAVPTLSEEVKENFAKFKDEILNGEKRIYGLEEAVFQQPTKLHITVNVLALFGSNEIEHAEKVLNSFKEDVLAPMLKGRRPAIRLRGLECMNPNYKQTHVLYAKARFENEDQQGVKLQDVVNKLSKYFEDNGLTKECKDDVKIHVTLINTKYRNSRDSPKRYKRIPVDARHIMDRYGDYDFGLTPFDSIHLSLMSSKGEDGFYMPVTKIAI